MAKTGPKTRTWEEILEILQDKSYLKEDTQCFIWMGYKVGKYGVICYQATNEYIHRLVYNKMVCKDIVEVVRHSCDNTLCWNPEHLLGGTHLDNTKDKVDRLRHKFGSNHYKAKITEELAAKVKFDNISLNEALRLGIPKGTYYGIKKGYIWTHVIDTRSSDKLIYINSEEMECQ